MRLALLLALLLAGCKHTPPAGEPSPERTRCIGECLLSMHYQICLQTCLAAAAGLAGRARLPSAP
ncbi:MAG: hypothetical protein WC969_15530 [Elusimicrobiota bacterium]